MLFGIQKIRVPEAFINRLRHHSGHGWRQAGIGPVPVTSGSLANTDIIEGGLD